MTGIDRQNLKELEKDMAREAGREMRGEFYRDISAALDRHPEPSRPDAPHGFTGREKADVLRHMADQIEKAQNPVERAQDRVAEREAFPNRHFFQKEPAKPTPSMVERWTQRAEQERAAMRERGGRDQQQEQEQERER